MCFVANQTSISSNTAVNSKNKKKITTQLKILENKRKAKCLRKAGGEVWADQTLEEWADEDYRIFCGDLGMYIYAQNTFPILLFLYLLCVFKSICC